MKVEYIMIKREKVNSNINHLRIIDKYEADYIT